MPLDPQIASILQITDRLGAPPTESLTAAEARARAAAGPTSPAPAVARIEMFQVPGSDGSVPVRVYTPYGRGPFQP